MTNIQRMGGTLLSLMVLFPPHAWAEKRISVKIFPLGKTYQSIDPTAVTFLGEDVLGTATDSGFSFTPVATIEATAVDGQYETEAIEGIQSTLPFVMRLKDEAAKLGANAVCSGSSCGSTTVNKHTEAIIQKTATAYRVEYNGYLYGWELGTNFAKAASAYDALARQRQQTERLEEEKTQREQYAQEAKTALAALPYSKSRDTIIADVSREFVERTFLVEISSQQGRFPDTTLAQLTPIQRDRIGKYFGRIVPEDGLLIDFLAKYGSESGYDSKLKTLWLPKLLELKKKYPKDFSDFAKLSIAATTKPPVESSSSGQTASKVNVPRKSPK